MSMSFARSDLIDPDVRFNDLKLEDKDLAIEYTIRSHGAKVGKSMLKDNVRIVNLFTWSDTREGREYWIKVCREITEEKKVKDIDSLFVEFYDTIKEINSVNKNK